MEQLEQEEIEKDIDLYKSMSAMADSDGGKIIITNLKRDVVSMIETLLSQYKSEKDIELRVTVARLEASLTLLRAMTRADKNKKEAQDALANLLAE